MNKNLVLFAVLFGMTTLAFCTSGADIGERFQGVFCSLYETLKSLIVPIIVMVIVFAGVIYVVGQVFGAETRAKAQGWATNMIIGVIIAILVIRVVPFILAQLAPELNIDTACA